MTQNCVYADFMRGADISVQTLQEDDGVVYNEYGVPKDILTIFKNHDLNWIRIRIFNNPSGNPYAVAQDLDYVTDLGARVKAAGFKFLLDFHYSDTWADPGSQTTPAAWSSYNHSQLVTAVHDYTQDVIEHLRLNNAMPDMVQIGNEVINGMLWPDGQIYGSGSWGNFVDLLNAGIDGVSDGRGTGPMPLIMIHIDRGGDWGSTEWFFDQILSRGVVFDVIGQSFYPEWHGTLDDLEYCLNQTAAKYPHDIVVAEAGDYYTSDGATPGSQKTYLEGVIQRVEAVPGGKGIGVFYWEPTWIWNSNVAYRALFEPISGDWQNVNMLPAMEAFDSPDAIPPAAPTGLTADLNGINVELDWDDNSEDDLDGYNVYRSLTSGGSYEKLNDTVLSNSSYSDETVIGGETYYYVVTAVDTSSNESGYSNEESAAVPDTGMGSVLREWWTGISGTAVSDLTGDADYPDNPTGAEQLTGFEGPINWDNEYGTRIRGYLHPPTTGDYTFWIAGDDNCQLWLSTDGMPANAVLIAEVTSWTDSREWDKYASQESAAISLAAEQKYYIEVLHKEGIGGDNIAVAWSGPGISQEVIGGQYLSRWLSGLYGDFTGEGDVNLDDVSAFLALWLEDGCVETARMDLDGNCIIDLYEFSKMAQNWLDN